MRYLKNSLALAGLLAANAVPAATISVNETTDELNSDGDCSLREAVTAANTNTTVDQCTAGDSGRDTIYMPAGTYTLSLTGTENDDASANDLDLTETAVIEGAAADQVTIKPVDAAAFADRAFHLVFVDLDLDEPMVMRDFTIHGFEGTTGFGGAIFSDRGLTLRNMNFTGNTSTSQGGAVTYGRENRDLTVDRSSFVDNRSSREGGALHILRAGSALVTDTTFVRNHSADNGGAIHIQGDPVALRNLTIADNSAVGDGGGIYVGTDGELLLRNAILDGNRVLGNGPNCALSGDAAGFTGSSDSGSTAFNLISDTSGCGQIGAFPDTITGQPAHLAMAGRYDGDTYFRPLLSGSPAIDAGSCATGGTNSVNVGTDQRQVSRITAGVTCDIGAAERNWTPFVVNSTSDAADANIDGSCDDGTGNCTLRAAIDEANEGIGLAEIRLGAGTHELALPTAGENANTNGDLDVLRSLIIRGEGAEASVIDANGIDRVLEIPSSGVAGSPTLALADLTIRGGDTGGPSGTPINDQRGGGILVNGPDGSTLLLDGVRVTGNKANDGAGTGFGGGVFVDAGVLHARGTLFDDNEAKEAYSAISFNNEASGWIERATVTGNRAIDNSAAIGTTGDSRLLIEHSTVADNTGIISGQLSTNAIIEVHASIIAGSPGSNCGPFSGGTIVDLGDNLEDGTDCGFTTGTQSANVDLAALADIGGPVPLREPNAGSDAVDGLPGGPCTSSSGRLLLTAPFGGTQPQDADSIGGVGTTGDGIYACDVGAAERQQLRMTAGPTAPSDQTVPVGSSDVVLAQITATNESGEPLERDTAVLSLRAIGSGDDSANITALRLYLDNNGDGQIDAGDSQRGTSQVFNADNGLVTFDFSSGSGAPPTNLASGDSAEYLVVADFAPQLTVANFSPIDQGFLLAGGSGALILLLGYFGFARRSPGLLVVTSVAALTLSACGGGGSGSSSEDDSFESSGLTETFAVQLESATVVGATSGRVIKLRTPAVSGAILTVED